MLTNSPDSTIQACDTLRENALELSIVMPCLDEARTLAVCVEKARTFLAEHAIEGEVLVADNGSQDGSPEIARIAGARVVHVPARGYGAALSGGIAAARGRFVIMGDCDDSYDFSRLAEFVIKLREGHDLVMGNRFAGGIGRGAMPALHRYFGNPLLSLLGRLFFKSNCRDFYCGLRGFSKSAFQRMELTSPGMEFALEMVIKATMFGLSVVEVPTILARDGRGRAPHLKSWRDGWRSLRLYLVCSPRWLFWYPGLALMSIGAAVGTWILFGPGRVGGVHLDVHTLVYCATAVVLGFQAAAFALFAKLVAIQSGLHPPSARVERFVARTTLEAGLFTGLALVTAGLCGSIYAVVRWRAAHYGDLDPFREMRIVIPSSLAILLGFALMFSSFYLELLRKKR